MTNLVIKQGEDCEIRIPNVRDANGALITVWTNFSVLAHVRSRVDSSTTLYVWTSQGVGANASFDGSDVVLEITAAASTAWTWTNGRWDVELTDPAGKQKRLDGGHLIIDRETTR